MEFRELNANEIADVSGGSLHIGSFVRAIGQALKRATERSTTPTDTTETPVKHPSSSFDPVTVRF